MKVTPQVKYIPVMRSKRLMGKHDAFYLQFRKAIEALLPCVEIGNLVGPVIIGDHFFILVDIKETKKAKVT